MILILQKSKTSEAPNPIKRGGLCNSFSRLKVKLYPSHSFQSLEIPEWEWRKKLGDTFCHILKEKHFKI